MATLADINATLQSHTPILESTKINVERLVVDQERSRLDTLEELRESRALQRGNRSSALGGFLGGAAGSGLMGNAKSLAAMGLAIPAFFGGLVAGDAAFTWLKSMGVSFDFEGLKSAAIGFSDIITSMGVGSFAVLAGIMAISAVGGTRAAKGLGAMGFAVSAFLGGLLAGDLLFEGVSALGGNLDFANIKTMFAGFSDVITALTPAAVAALGGILTTGALVGYSPLRAKTLARGLGTIAMGMVALFGGLIAAETLVEGAENVLGTDLDFTRIKTMFAGFSDVIIALTPAAVAALGGILAAGTVFGNIAGPATMAKTVAGVGAISASIAAFFAGFSVMDAVAREIGEGGSAKTLITNFAEAISALDDRTITILGSLIGAGGALGALTAATGGLGVAVFAGIPALGASIAGFFLAFDGLAAVASIVGVDGSNTKALLSNFAAGIQELTSLDVTNAAAVGDALTSLSAGMTAFFAADALGKTIGVFEKIGGAFKAGWNYIWGIEDNSSDGDSPFSKMVQALKPIEDLNDTTISKLNDFGAALDRLFASFKQFGEGDIGTTFTSNIANMVRGIGAVIDMWPYLLTGGNYRPPSGGFLGYQDIRFGPEGTGGIQGILDNEADIDVVAEGIKKIYSALGVEAPASPNIAPVQRPDVGITSNTLKDLYVENLIAEKMATGSIIINAPTDARSSATSNTGFNLPSRLTAADVQRQAREGLLPRSGR